MCMALRVRLHFWLNHRMRGKKLDKKSTSPSTHTAIYGKVITISWINDSENLFRSQDAKALQAIVRCAETAVCSKALLCGYADIFSLPLGKAKPFTHVCFSSFSDMGHATGIASTRPKHMIRPAALANDITGLSSNNIDIPIMGYRRFF